MVLIRERPPRPWGGSLGGPKAKQSPSPMQHGTSWSQSEGVALAHAAGALVVLKQGGALAPAAGARLIP